MPHLIGKKWAAQGVSTAIAYTIPGEVPQEAAREIQADYLIEILEKLGEGKFSWRNTITLRLDGQSVQHSFIGVGKYYKEESKLYLDLASSGNWQAIPPIGNITFLAQQKLLARLDRCGKYLDVNLNEFGFSIQPPGSADIPYTLTNQFQAKRVHL